MSTQVGISTPILVPVTGTFAPAFAAYYIILNLRVSIIRNDEKKWIGNQLPPPAPQTPGGDIDDIDDPDNPPKSNAATSSSSTSQTQTHSPLSDDPLLTASRTHANFVENVPLALLVAAMAELNGGGRRVLAGSLAWLLFCRVAHVEFGLRRKNAMGWGRAVGYFGTLGYVAGMSLYAASLALGEWVW